MFNKFQTLLIRSELKFEGRVPVVRGSLELREVEGESVAQRRERLQQEPVRPVQRQRRRNVFVNDVKSGSLKNNFFVSYCFSFFLSFIFNNFSRIISDNKLKARRPFYPHPVFINVQSTSSFKPTNQKQIKLFSPKNIKICNFSLNDNQ